MGDGRAGKSKVFHDEVRTKVYRQDDESAIATQGHEHLSNRLQDICGSFPHRISILDLGCGTGRYFHCLRNVDRLTGIDISLPMLREARTPVRMDETTDIPIDLICGDLFESGFNSESFDFIYSIGVFVGYSSFTLPVYHQLFDLLKPGGKLFFTVQNVAAQVTQNGLRKAMEMSPFAQYEISDYGSVPGMQKSYFLECLATKDTSRSSARVQPPFEKRSAHTGDVCWLNVNLLTPEIVARIPPDGTFILIDDEVFRNELSIGRRALPFLERDGKYWGPPNDDENAIEELERMRRAGATFAVFAWPSFWWLDHYSGLQRHLRRNFPCVLETELMIMFDLRS